MSPLEKSIVMINVRYYFFIIVLPLGCLTMKMNFILASIGEKYRIDKYPTMKFFRHGSPIKKEYRLSRDFHSLLKYFLSEVESSLIRLNSTDDLEKKFNEDKAFFIGQFFNEKSENFLRFKKISDLLRDQCQFVYSIDDKFLNENLVYHPNEDDKSSKRIVYQGNLTDENEIYYWSSKLCLKKIRKLNYENAEELIDESFPFLILFHRKTDSNSLKIFENQIENQFRHSNSVTFLHVDAEDFLYPLKSFGKTVDDLPLIILDNFHQMFLFFPFEQIQIKGKLLEFVGQCLEKAVDHNRKKMNSIEIRSSSFVHLKANRRRYSFRDEL